MSFHKDLQGNSVQTRRHYCTRFLSTW